MNGDYIKIISDGSQLFVKDTECFLLINGRYARPTLSEFSNFINVGTADFLGQHIVNSISECESRSIPLGTKIWDLEWCETNEFYFVHVSMSKEIDHDGNEIV